jgi:hypothetical protein
LLLLLSSFWRQLENRTTERTLSKRKQLSVALGLTAWMQQGLNQSFNQSIKIKERRKAMKNLDPQGSGGGGAGEEEEEQEQQQQQQHTAADAAAAADDASDDGFMARLLTPGEDADRLMRNLVLGVGGSLSTYFGRARTASHFVALCLLLLVMVYTHTHTHTHTQTPVLHNT